MIKELTPLEALERLYDYHNLYNRNVVAYLLEQENLPTYRKIIETTLKEKEKQDKILNIVKEKVTCLIGLEDETELRKGCYRLYDNEYYIHCDITKEEYDLLKELFL